MEAEKIILPNGNNATLATTHTLTAANDATIKAVPVSAKKAVVFFIGGAADQTSYYFQGPNKNIDFAKLNLDEKITQAQLKQKYISTSKGYYDAKGAGDIQKNFIAMIPNKSCPVYVIGHSLGGWNGAHLSRLLTEAGYTVKILVTLDPVGEGFWVWLGSDIYNSEPSPVAETWINIRANSNHPDQSDGVANFGGRWVVKSGPNINAVVDIHHADADRIFLAPIQGAKSARDLVFDSINEIFNP